MKPLIVELKIYLNKMEGWLVVALVGWWDLNFNNSMILNVANYNGNQQQ